MKSSKLFVPALTALLALALAAPALATLATSPAGTLYTGMLSGTSEGHMSFHGPAGTGITIECNGEVEGKIISHGPTATGVGETTKWVYQNCTNGWVVESLELGKTEIHSLGGGLGTITSTGTKGRAKNSTLGLTCVYETNNTDLGKVTDSSVTAGKATLDLSGVIPTVAGSSIFCGSSATLTGYAVVNTPASIFID